MKFIHGWICSALVAPAFSQTAALSTPESRASARQTTGGVADSAQLDPRQQRVSFRPFQPAPGRAGAAPDPRPYCGADIDGVARRTLVDVDAPLPPVTPAELDDAVPLPEPPVYEVGDDGDVLVAPASGDPYFLGFAAGAYYPPQDERIDPEFAARLRSSYDDGRPTPETYAFVMFRRRITPERVAEIEALGARVLQFHPHHSLKVALPAQAVDGVAAHPAVRWVGDARAWQKLHPRLVEECAHVDGGEFVDVTIDVFDSDLDSRSTPLFASAPEFASAGKVTGEGEAQPLANVWRTNGWMQHALERAGVEVFDYDESIQAFRGRATPAVIEALVALDFVQFVEWRAPAELMHGESMPMIHADRARQFHDGGVNSRAIVALVDTGIQVGHEALNQMYAAGWNFSGDGLSTFDDNCGHGTHVCGTICGNSIDPAQNGAAPGLGWGPLAPLYSVKVFSSCFSTSVNLSQVLGVTTSPSSIPQVVNQSWGTLGTLNSSTAWRGSEADCRALDAVAYSPGQLHVFPAGNLGGGAYSITQQGSAKNVLTVGAVTDYLQPGAAAAGDRWSFSSVGPVGDTRWKPNVVAPGAAIRSVNSASTNGFVDKSGTSQAAAHVTGVVADMIDASAQWQYLPERVAAQLMATAFRNNDQLLQIPSDAHLRQYGAGRVDAGRAIAGDGSDYFATWDFFLAAGTSTYRDFTVPAGAERLVIAMNYVEPACSAGASKALVSNFDLFIDQPPLSSGDNTGDWTAQQSGFDNSELRVLNNPVPGVWRLKFWPQSTTSGAYIAATVLVQLDATPTPSVTLSTLDEFVKPGESVTIVAWVLSASGRADALFLDSTSSGDVLAIASSLLAGGVETDLLTNQHAGRDVMLGVVTPTNPRQMAWETSWTTEGFKPFTVRATGDNFAPVQQTIQVAVDGTPPSNPTSLQCTSHTSQWSNDISLDFTWNAGTDALSGLAGYSYALGTSPITVDTSVDATATATGATLFTGVDSASYFFGIRTVDRSGNWSATKQIGPFRIDTDAPGAPGPISSTTHSPGVLSCDSTVAVHWTPATDALSGISGYRVAVDGSPTTVVTGAPNLPAGATSWSVALSSTGAARYFHLAAVDLAGNWGPTRHFGPVLVNAATVTSYCTSKLNSLGCAPAIGSVNTPSLNGGAFRTTCTNVINQRNGLLFWGFAQAAVPFQGGWFCVNPPTIRTTATNSGGPVSGTSCSGSYSFQWTTGYIQQNALQPGDTLYCQWWMRDPASPSTTGFSNALKFTLCQ